MGKKMVLFLLLLSALILIVSCSASETPKHTTSVESSTVLTPIDTTPISVGKDTPENLAYRTNTNLSESGITVPTASLISGTLLVLNENSRYCYDTASLCPVSEISSSVTVVKSQNLVRLYGRKSQNYLLASSQIFLKEDAFQPWENLLAAFVAATGKKSVQVVSGYIYNGEESLNGSFVTGYSLAINLYENGANYSLASAEKSITVNGKNMTCLDWFQDHCAQYGFVYTGLEGSQARTLATFRYVGVPHALAMQRLDYVDTKEYYGFLRYYTGQHTVTDFESGITWNIDFYAADKTSALTTIAIPKGAVYTVSGNNVDGFIVAYYIP